MNLPDRMGSFLLLFGMLAFPAEALSCKCGLPFEDEDTDIKVSVGRADVVFLGIAEKVVRVATPKEIIQKEGFDPKVDETTFKVLKSWKGVSSDRIVSRISIVCCLCGYTFEAGLTYLVYAMMKDGGTIYSSVCSRTRPLASEEMSQSMDIEVLNRYWGKKE